MYIKPPQKKSSLIISDDFAQLYNVASNGDLHFSFSYGISQRDVINKNAMTVDVTVYTKALAPPPVLSYAAGNLDAKKVVKNVLTQMVNAKSAARQQDTYVVAKKTCDNTTLVNNQAISKLKAGVSPSVITGIAKTILATVPVQELKSRAGAQPIFNYSTVNATSGSIDTQELIYKMVLHDGVDPSIVTSMTHRSVTPYDVVGGLTKKLRMSEVSTSAASRYANLLVNPSTRQRTTDQVVGSTHVQVPVTNDSDVVYPIVDVIVPATYQKVDGTSNSNLFVKFELIDATTKLPIDTVIRTLDVQRHLQLLHTPRLAPTVKLAHAEISSKVNLEIKQNDPDAVGVRIYKKSIFRAVADVDFYSLVGDYPVRSTDQSLLLTVDVPLTSAALYRVIPVGAAGALSFEYTNVVVKPKKYFPLKHVSLTIVSTDQGVRAEIRNIPKGVAAVQLVRADKTINEQLPRAVSAMQLVDSTAYVAIADRTAKDGHVYEYACKLIYDSGSTELSGNLIKEFIKNNAGQVDTTIDELHVTNDGNQVDVSFNVTTRLPESDIDSVKRMLNQQNLLSLYPSELLNERDKLQQLIGHHVTRVNLTTGQHEDFGIIPGSQFSDSALRKNNAILPLVSGQKYRYDVSVLLRSPETMFEKFVKPAVDATSNRAYEFKPSKFLHPITLKSGNLVSPEALATNYAKSAMTHGQIGNVTSVEVSLDKQPVKAINPTVSRFNDITNVVTWKLQGDINQVDHFIIMKEVMGVRTIVGKAHSEFANGNCLYLHTLTSRDRGALSYIIVPVFNSYKLGESATTNQIVI